VTSGTTRAFGAGAAALLLAAGAASDCASTPSDPCSPTGDDAPTGGQESSSCAPPADACGAPKDFASTAVASGASQALELHGFARDPGAQIRIESYNGCGTKGTKLTDRVHAGNTASVPGPDALYPWSVTVPVTPGVWPAGGTLQIRALSRPDGEGAFVLGRAAPFEDIRCVKANGQLGWEGVLGKCTRYTSRADQLADPLVTFVDRDVVPTTPGTPQFLQAVPTSVTDAENYYASIDAGPGTSGGPPGSRHAFSGWKAANGFGDDDAHAVYYNEGDLGTGRDMHCREVKACEGSAPPCLTGSPACSVTVRIACYVTNYLDQDPAGPTVTFPASCDAVDDAKHGTLPAATVAMEALLANVDCDTGTKSEISFAAPDRVRFYIYDTLSLGTGNVLPAVLLDSEGPKAAPGVCLSCHGGKFDPTSAQVTGATFLPFDTSGFRCSCSDECDNCLIAQGEAFKHLNALVHKSLPTPAIRELIDGWYGPKGVFDQASQFDGAFIPPAWSDQRELYLNVVKPHCRSCHAAQGTTTPDLTRYSDFQQFAPYIQDGLCNGKPGFTMAEQTRRNFLKDPARAYLTDWLGSVAGPLPGLQPRVLPQCQGQPPQQPHQCQ
jgi:hypothetical protein